MKNSFKTLNETIIRCRLCPRLVVYRETEPKRASFADEEYWRKPVPGFGDPDAWLVIIGLAPAAHGGNRTGRVFTGDESGRFLFQGLYLEGLANQPTSLYRGDGLQLIGGYITAAVKCFPPDNKPTHQECINCSQYLENELFLLKNATTVLALGRLGFDAYKKYAKTRGAIVKGVNFGFGASYSLDGLPKLYASYHPTPRNTNTGTLTMDMFRGLLRRIKEERCG
jgi:uracil-DNA glycosylase family 4